MKINIEFPRKLLEVYNDACKPLCKKLKLPQTAFDILMFLGNNPQYQTARDIVKIRNIKANLISINVEKLVKEGYLRREEIKGDRRKNKTDYYRKSTSSDQRRTAVTTRICRSVV